MMKNIGKRLRIGLFGLFLLLVASVSANNIQVTNVSLTGSILTFSVSWDNSWRTTTTAPYNWDAAWIFVKYRDCATLQWAHADIDSASAASPLVADTTADQKGVMIYRSANGTGNISNVQVNLRLTGLPSGNFDFNVFAVEMVYVPTDSFYLGDGSSTYTWRQGTNAANPYYLTSEAAITMANSGTNLYAAAQVTAGTIPAVYPKGYDAFYCMKYEISQQQYADYLNTLTSAQVVPRYNITTANRYTITGAWPTLTATAGNRACNWLNWDDLMTYLDWAALRPMTELEFEKAARGPGIYVPDEFAWGTNLIVDANTVVNDGSATESVSNAIPAGYGIANYGNNIVTGPLRCGFAGTAATNRLQIGASYYGICELSGNVWEIVVSTGSTLGRTFVPAYGDGRISPVGLYDVAQWGASSSAGIRGGNWGAPVADLRISDRSLAVYTTSTRFNTMGGRGVRK